MVYSSLAGTKTLSTPPKKTHSTTPKTPTNLQPKPLTVSFLLLLLIAILRMSVIVKHLFHLYYQKNACHLPTVPIFGTQSIFFGALSCYHTTKPLFFRSIKIYFLLKWLKFLPISPIGITLFERNRIMTPASTSGATQGVSAQFQAAALKTAQNVQKQEGEAAVSLIQSAVEATDHSIPGGTGNNIDVTA